MSQKIYIYALTDPDSNLIRYIGKSIKPKERLQNHMNEVSNCHRSHWLQSLKKQGKKAKMKFLEVLEYGENWQERERYWIKKGKAEGWPLTNNTSGGDGACDLPEATRQKMRLTWLGRKHKPETIEKLKIANAGRVRSKKHKQHMSEIMKGREIKWGRKIAEATSKFTPLQQSIIRCRLRAGEKVKDLADIYGVHRTTISKVKLYQYNPKSKDYYNPSHKATLPEWLA
jgi:hypothetical protein